MNTNKEKTDKLIGQYIKSKRKEKGITQKEIAKMLNKGYSTYQKYELGITPIPLTIMTEIIKILQFDFIDLMEYASPYEDMGYDEYKENMSVLIEINNLKELRQQERNNKKQLLNNYEKLNTDGKKEAIKRVEELTEIPKYTKPNNED